MAAGNNDIRDDVREIDTGAPMERFARGWHCVGLAEDFRDGQPHAVNAFGTRLVVFADSHGDLQVLDAYCRHMGGDLSRGGSVKGDSVACPFHDWRWQARPASAPWCRTPSAHRGWPAPDDGPPARSTASCWCGTTPPKLRAAARIVPPRPSRGTTRGGSGHRGRGTRSPSRARTAARSSTTTSTWRTSSTFTTPTRPTSRTSSKGTPPRSSWSPRPARTPPRITRSSGRERSCARRPPTSAPAT